MFAARHPVHRALKPGEVQRILERDGEPVGRIVAHREGVWLRVDHVSVFDPHDRRNGIGYRLYWTAFTEAKAMGCYGLSSDPRLRTAASSRIWARIATEQEHGIDYCRTMAPPE